MPADDSLFEKALARQLRNRSAEDVAGTNREAASDGPFAGQDKLCPDVQLLAAYHEHSLADDEMSLWKEHIFSCARCQEILSQLEATENILVSNREQGEVAAVEGGGILMNTESLASAPVRSAAAHEMPQFARRANVPAAAASDRPHEAAAKRRSGIRFWIVPAGAIAATLLVWIAIRPRPGHFSNKVEQQIAENRQPNQPVEGPLNQRSDSGDLKSIPAPKMTYDRTRSSTELDALAEKKSSVKQPPPMIEYKAVPRDGRSAGLSGGTEAQKSTAQADSRAESVAPKAATQTVQVMSEAPAVSTPASGASQLPLPSGQELQTSQMAAAPAAPPKPQYDADKMKDKEAQARDAQDASTALMNLQAGTGGAAAKGVVGFRNMASIQNIHMIAAPGGNVIWRVGNPGVIEESADAGASWTRQNSGVSVILDSGTAPSEAVCWVFGHAGTILRTIDGGAHWSKITSPIAGDVGGLSAADALHATVWDVGKKNNFVTSDGGASWTRVANP